MTNNLTNNIYYLLADNILSHIMGLTMTEIKQTHPHITFNKSWSYDEEIMFMLGQCDAIIQGISNVPIKPEYKQELLNVSLRKGARATTAIEGNTLTEDEVARIDKGESLPPSRRYLEREVKNILDAFNDILRDVVYNSTAALVTPELILNFHKAVGKELGEHFNAVPGRFRGLGEDVVVGRYRPPQGVFAKDLILEFCRWLQNEFKFETGEQHFSMKIIQAIVSHIYIAWIHPFMDGNGRTARLIEFYILLRAGLPDIASHILSNFYNDTREEYYRQLDHTVKTGELTAFIKYAVRGFRDGLNSVYDVVYKNLLETSWEHFIFGQLDSKKAEGKTKAVVKRRRTLALNFPVDAFYTIEELFSKSAPIIREYAKLGTATFRRDLEELLQLELVVQKEKTYKGNIDILHARMALRRQ